VWERKRLGRGRVFDVLRVELTLMTRSQKGDGDSEKRFHEIVILAAVKIET